MLGGITNITTVLGSAPPPDADTARLKSFARACCEAGLYLLLIEPGGKQPVDVRSAVQRRNDDKEAQQVARQAGRADWDRVKSKGGVYLATNDPTRICRYIDAYRSERMGKIDDRLGPGSVMNFGIDVGRSNLVVVDCDTGEQVAAFLDYVRSAADLDVTPDIPPTVRTPGQTDAGGNWAHRDGGHFYFTVDSPLPDRSGSLTMPGGWVMLWANRYVLIPPSVRPEGPYRLVGQDFPAPPWMTELVTETVTAQLQRRVDALANTDLTDAVNQWAATVEWDDLLSPAGWTLTARQDTCGCDIWTAPGDHASPKSATAHDTDCTLGRYTPENAPLHIWTDYPGEELEAWMAARGKTLSRLQVAAALDYGGDVGKAMRALNVTVSASAALGFGDARDVVAEAGASAGHLDEPLPDPEPSAPADLFGAARGLTGDEPPGAATPVASPPVEESSIAGVPVIKPFDHWRDFPPPEFAIEGLLEHRGFTALIGAPGVGKSGAVLGMAGSIATGRRWMGRATLKQRVLYLPGEGLSGAVQRIKAWESAYDEDLGQDLYVGDSIIQVAASPEAWAKVVQDVVTYEIGMIIIDTWARATVGLEENSATDVGKAIARFDQVRKATGAGLMVVHHTRKDGGQGRGSSALNGALDTELLLVQEDWWEDPNDGVTRPPIGRQLQLKVPKQKNAAQPENGIPLLAVGHGDSFIVTGPSGIADDPLDAVGVVKVAVVPEPIVNVAIRLQEYSQRFTTQGLTRSEFAYGVPPDDYSHQRHDAKTAWRMKVNEAVDLGLRYGLIQTLTGSATGARYVPDLTTADQARARWAAEGMAD